MGSGRAVLQHDLPRAGRLSVDVRAEQAGDDGTEPTGAESQLQLYRGPGRARRTDAAEEAVDDWISTERDQRDRKGPPKNGGAGDG